MVVESTPAADRQPADAEPNGSRWAFLFAFAVFASLTFLIFYSRFSVPGEQMGGDHPGVGHKLSVFHVEPFVAAEHAIDRADLEGRVTLINYWGPWCPPCRIEMPHLVEIQQDYRQDEQFQLLSIACGTWVYPSLDAMRTETAKYHDQARLEFPVYLDVNFTSRTGLEADLGMEGRSLAYPTTVLIDPQGTIAAVWEGYSAEVPSQMRAAIDRLSVAPTR